jgi:hypothetical protein
MPPPEASTSGFSLASVAPVGEFQWIGIADRRRHGSSVVQRPVVEAVEAGLVDVDHAQAPGWSGSASECACCRRATSSSPAGRSWPRCAASLRCGRRPDQRVRETFSARRC